MSKLFVMRKFVKRPGKIMEIGGLRSGRIPNIPKKKNVLLPLITKRSQHSMHMGQPLNYRDIFQVTGTTIYGPNLAKARAPQSHNQIKPAGNILVFIHII